MITTSLGNKTVGILFYCIVNEFSTRKLMNVIQDQLKKGAERFIISISSPGGYVFHAISAYNFLKGIPAEIITHNFGNVISSASIIYCAGSKRYSVSQGKFLLHPITQRLSKGADFTVEDLDESIKSMQVDTQSLIAVYSMTTGKSLEEMGNLLKERTSLDSIQARNYGLVHEIKDSLFEKGTEIISISDTIENTK